MLKLLFSSPMLLLLALSFAALTGLLPARRRDLREKVVFVLWGVIAAALVWTADHFFVSSSNASTSLQPFLCLTALVLFGRFAAGERWKSSIYCAVLAFILAEELAQWVFMPFLGEPWFGIEALSVICKLLVLAGIAVAVWALVRHLLAPRMMAGDDYSISGRKLLFTLLLLALYLLMTNYQFIFWIMGSSGYSERGPFNMVFLFRVIFGLFALVILFLQNDMEKSAAARQELNWTRQMWKRQQEQYELSKENIEVINRKCHDLKHQIAAIRAIRDQAELDRHIAEVEDAVMIYDSSVQTGNSVLDVVLTEKILYCEAHKINITCLVDGSRLEFMDKVDLYTLFGNALDNAIESVMQEKDKRKRVIQVASVEEKNVLLIRIRNYCENVPELVDGLPVTTKEDADYHGFGLKSIRFTAEKYGGGITIRTGTNFFTLQILLPLPEKAA